MSETPPKITCPKCGSDQITANKKGFSAGKAVVGGLLTGGIGLAAGAIGSGKIKITCLNCGHEFKPGEKAKEAVAPADVKNATGGCILVIVIFVIIYWILGT